MINITDNNITMTRGDDVSFSVTLYSDGTLYTMNAQDVLKFTVRQKLKRGTETPLIQKTYTGTSTISLADTDTSDLAYGQYVYDVEVTLSTGAVHTVIEPHKFVLDGEVS